MEPEKEISREATTDDAQRGLRIDPRLLEILVCPLTRSTLKYDSERQELVSANAKLAFPIKDGIPIMLVHEARQTG